MIHQWFDWCYQTIIYIRENLVEWIPRNVEEARVPFNALLVVVREISRHTRFSRPDKIANKHGKKPPPALFPTFIENTG